MITYSMGLRSSACERRRATRRADPGATSSLRAIAASARAASIHSLAPKTFCPENFASHSYKEPASSSSGVGWRPAAKIHGASQDFGHADRLVVCEQKSADVKSRRPVFELKRFGGFSSRRRAFCAKCGVGRAQAAPPHILREAREFVDRLLDLWGKDSRTATGLPSDEALLPKPLERCASRRAADLEGRVDLRFGRQDVAGPKLAPGDGTTKPVRYLTPKRRGVGR